MAKLLCYEGSTVGAAGSEKPEIVTIWLFRGNVCWSLLHHLFCLFWFWFPDVYVITERGGPELTNQSSQMPSTGNLSHLLLLQYPALLLFSRSVMSDSL